MLLFRDSPTYLDRLKLVWSVYCEFNPIHPVAINVPTYAKLKLMTNLSTTRVLHSYRLLCSIVLGVLVALGLSSKAYSGWGQVWVNNASGDVLYEMFWIWLVGGWQARWRVGRIAIATFLITAMIEFSQLIAFPPVWQSQLWWRLLLGTTFSWPDFAYYAMGCTLGAIGLSWIQSRFGLSRK